MSQFFIFIEYLIQIIHLIVKNIDIEFNVIRFNKKLNRTKKIYFYYHNEKVF